MDRRDFLTVAFGSVLGAGASAYGVRLLTARQATRPPGLRDASDTRRWGMVIDLNKCSTKPDCDACMKACRHENNVAFHHDDRYDIHWIRKVKIRSKGEKHEHAKEKTVILLCNHCEHPPCAQVCPVQATYKRADGIVLVDHHRCIGCRYCVMSCPYNARYFNFKENEEWPNKKYPKRSHGVAESCNLCAHLLDRLEEPSCVKACPADAITVGDLNDPESEVFRLIEEQSPKRLRADLGTEPKVYYIGL